MKRFTICLALATTCSAVAAQESQRSPSTVFRTGTNLVALNVTVTDARKHFVSGLTQADFAIYEDGVLQRLDFFEASEVPIDLILLIDTSSSMRDRMNVVHEAAVGFLRTLDGEDRGAVVAFNDGVEVLQALTADVDSLERAVRSTSGRGSTSLHNALYIALKQFGRAAAAAPGGEVRRQAIAVLSDGEDTSSLISFDDVMALARRSGVSIYTIGLQSRWATRRTGYTPRYFSTADYSLKSLARETGGQSFFPMRVEELRGVYASIAEELASQYSLAYSPANPRSDGRFRRIVVRVSDRPELQLRTRSGYIAEPDRAVSAYSRAR